MPTPVRESEFMNEIRIARQIRKKKQVYIFSEFSKQNNNI